MKNSLVIEREDMAVLSKAVSTISLPLNMAAQAKTPSVLRGKLLRAYLDDEVLPLRMGI